jgi:hypothetical protein
MATIYTYVDIVFAACSEVFLVVEATVVSAAMNPPVLAEAKPY